MILLEDIGKLFFFPGVYLLFGGIAFFFFRLKSVLRKKKASWLIVFYLLVSILLSRFLITFYATISSRYVANVYIFGFPFVVYPLYLLRHQHFFCRGCHLHSILILIILFAAFFLCKNKLSKNNGFKLLDFQKIDYSLLKNKDYENVFLFDLAEESDRILYYSAKSRPTVIPKMKTLLNDPDSNHLKNSWPGMNDALNKSDRLFFIVSHNNYDQFMSFQTKLLDINNFDSSLLLSTSRHYIFEMVNKENRYGASIAVDHSVLDDSNSVFWDGDLLEIAPFNDPKTVLTIKNNGFIIHDDLTFPVKWYPHPGHGFYNRDPESLAEIQCFIDNGIPQISFKNTGTRAYGGVYSREKVHLTDNVTCRVIFRGDNGGHFSIGARVYNDDASFSFDVFHSFSVLKSDNWYCGKFSMEAYRGKTILPIIVFEGGSVSIADVKFYSEKQ